MKYKILLLLLLFISCNQREIHKNETIILKKNIILQGEVVKRGSVANDWYDIQLIGDHYGIIDYQNDTLLSIYDNKNYLVHNFLQKQHHYLPQLIKKEANNDCLEIKVYNNLSGEYTQLSYENSKYKEQKKKLPHYFVNFGHLPKLSECIHTERGIYGTLLEPKYVATFYYLHPDTGYVFGEPEMTISRHIQPQTLAYACHMTLNEKKERVITASRFTNTIHFYNLEGKTLKTIKIGEEDLQPLTHPGTNTLDIENSRKYFIAADGSSRYVYLLYSGSENILSTPSQIVVFDWNGRYITAFQLDKPLTAFAVNKEDKYILGISRNESGTEVVSWTLPKKIK